MIHLDILIYRMKERKKQDQLRGKKKEVELLLLVCITNHYYVKNIFRANKLFIIYQCKARNFVQKSSVEK